MIEFVGGGLSVLFGNWNYLKDIKRDVGSKAIYPEFHNREWGLHSSLLIIFCQK
jgi:hypothetical protein